MNCIDHTYADGRIRLYWTGGAGFIITRDDLRIGIDLFLTDACRREGSDEFKRLTLAPCKPEELKLDYLISTHDHGDHFDVEGVPVIMKNNPEMKIICPSSVIHFAQDLGISTDHFICMNRGEIFKEDRFSLSAVTADHQDQSPDAIGVVFRIGDVRILFAGDGTYHDHYEELTGNETGFDILLVAINGQYGNPDSDEAAKIASMLKAKLAIPCHYWMFKEHGGDPRTFVEACLKQTPCVTPKILAVGEEFII